MSTKPELAKFDRATVEELEPLEWLRFKIGRKVIDRLVMRLICRAYERSLINTAVMHELSFIWKCICFPERNDDYYGGSLPGEPLPLVKRWYRRGERELQLPAVLAFIGKTPEEYFTSVFAGLETEEQRWFVNSEHWTHWHPLDAPPLNDGPDKALEEAAKTVAAIAGLPAH